MSGPRVSGRWREWALAAGVAAAVMVYLVRHRVLVSELPRLWEALF
jgi:hypothetical protein